MIMTGSMRRATELSRRLPPHRGLTVVISCTTGPDHVTLRTPAKKTHRSGWTQQRTFESTTALCTVRQASFWLFDCGAECLRSLDKREPLRSALVRRIVIASSTLHFPKVGARRVPVSGVLGYHPRGCCSSRLWLDWCALAYFSRFFTSSSAYIKHRSHPLDPNS